MTVQNAVPAQPVIPQPTPEKREQAHIPNVPKRQ